MTNPPTFKHLQHGPALWKLQGLKWNDREISNARIFEGWTAARLAPLLGLNLDAVEAILSGAAAPAPAPVAPAPSVAARPAADGRCRGAAGGPVHLGALRRHCA